MVNGKAQGKKLREAVALKYSQDEDKAPKIVAAGKGELAENILKSAQDSDVPVYENAELAHTLSKLNIGDEIPPELYEVIAEILVFISNLDKKAEKKYEL